MRARDKVAVNCRLHPDVVKNIDEAAEIMGMRRGTYCQYVLEALHGNDFNPVKTAHMLLDLAANYEDLEG